MARNGSGTYSLPAGNPVVTGTVISSTVQNNTMNDVATALTQSIAYDGQTVPVANLPMGTYRHTGVGNAVNLTDYAAAGQTQNGEMNWCGTAGGTKNALTISPTPAITSYQAGQRFYFKSGATASDSTVTIAISGLSTIAVQVNGAACSGGEIQANRWYEVVLDSTSTCQLNRIAGVSGFMQTVLDDLDAATARATLGLPLAGSILQVAMGSTDTTFSSSSTTFADVTGLSVTLTPRNTSSKILILGVVQLGSLGTGGSGVYVRLLRGSTFLDPASARGIRTPVTAVADLNAGRNITAAPIMYLDSPATASAVTYKIQYAAQQAGLTGWVNQSGTDDNQSYTPIVKSYIIALEVAA